MDADHPAPQASTSAVKVEPQNVAVRTVPAGSGVNEPVGVGTGAAKRTTVACTRCRRQKQKCVNTGAPPCTSCTARGLEAECVLGEKGAAGEDRGSAAVAGSRKRFRPDQDLEPDHFFRRTSATSVPPGGDSASPPAAGSPRGTAAVVIDRPMAPARPAQDDGLLPALPLLIEGCESFFQGYFQLGFLHRPSFLHKVSTNAASISPFLLLSMLAVSARFTPGLIDKFGSPTSAASHYQKKALAMVPDEIVEPSLERAQALYLLGVADFGSRLGFRSRMLHSMARQMAEPLKLHDELPTLGVVENEVRRRTWWFLTMGTNPLNAGGPFDPFTVPIPLPSQEDAFTFGEKSLPPQYFPNSASAAALRSPTVPGARSLLGALLSIVAIWGQTARSVCESDPATAIPPWQPDSLLTTTQRDLEAWHSVLSPKQKWSTANLLAYRNSHLDLGYWCLFCHFHAVSILLSRPYLPQMIKVLDPSSNRDDPSALAVNGVVPPSGVDYYVQMANAMVGHAFDIIELQEEVAGIRSTAKGTTPHLAFCIYLAGTILCYLRSCPWLCPSRAAQAPQKIVVALSMLQHVCTVWPIGKRWHRTLYLQATTGPDSIGGKHAHGIAQADNHLDHPAALYRAPSTSSDAATSPTYQLDAASTLAMMAATSTPSAKPGLGAPAPLPPSSLSFPPPPTSLAMSIPPWQPAATGGLPASASPAFRSLLSNADAGRAAIAQSTSTTDADTSLPPPGPPPAFAGPSSSPSSSSSTSPTLDVPAASFPNLFSPPSNGTGEADGDVEGARRASGSGSRTGARGEGDVSKDLALNLDLGRFKDELSAFLNGV
ncbi:hypothetical protein JCM5296_002322 [Sporobolomyces johnsonii]